MYIKDTTLNHTEAVAVLETWWDKTGHPEHQRNRDWRDLLTYMTLRLDDGRSIRKTGNGKYVLRGPATGDIPGSVIEEWLSS